MDTGSGKTLVAVMLIKEMVERELEAKRSPAERKICFFIVNNVPLVFQQAEVVRSNSNLEVSDMCGEKQTVGKFSQELWDLAYNRADVVVLTAQILLDLLRHGFIKMSKIHLLIFDECHHARKDHPFCCIMKEFYHNTPENDRPKVFGMTASPSMDVGTKLYHSARELEELLDATIFTIHPNEVQVYVERPKEVIVQYHEPKKYATTQLTKRLRKQCSMITKLNASFESTTHNLAHLGPWCVDRLWKLHVEKLGESGDPANVTSEMKLALGIIKAIPLPPPVYSEKNLSPKVLKLIQLLRVAAQLKDEFCGIVFVQRRDTAMALCMLLQELEEFQNVFRVQILAGHSDGSERILRMSFRDQTAIISHFRNKVYNLLIATSVAEEGLDIQPCNFVVRFDPATTIISYIQSRGRARKRNSRYLMMHEVDNRGEEAAFEKIKYSETSMREWCSSLSEDRLMKSPLEDDDSALDKHDKQQTFKVDSTNALLTLDSAIALVPYFNTMPTGGTFFVCDLMLPANAPIRAVQSDYMTTKNMAKKSAAFKACEQLYRLGALNENLLPVMSGAARKDEVGEATVIDNKDKNKSYPVAIPEFWRRMPMAAGRPAIIFGCVIELTEEDQEHLGGKDRYRAMCLLTYRPIPCHIAPFHLYLDGDKRTVTMRNNPNPMRMDQGRLGMLRQFTLNIFQKICRKSFDCAIEDIPYFVAPLRKGFDERQAIDTSIAWDDIQLGQGSTAQPLSDNDKDDQQILNCVTTLRNDSGRDFFIKKVMREFRMDDPIPEHLYGSKEIDAWDDAIAKGKTPPLCNIKGRTFAAYFKWKQNCDCPDDDVVLSVDRVRKMRNNLQPAVREEEKREERTTVVMPLSVFMLYPVHADVLRMSQLIPSVLYNLDSVLLVQEVRDKVKLMDTRLDYLQEAFTSTSANRGYQYERLELLGDSFLKFSSTIRLYIVNPSKDEGQLHGHRIRIISNSALLEHCTKHELYRYLCTTPFHRTSWRPTRFIVDGKAWNDSPSHNLSNKMLADVVEATLGAAYLCGGIKNAFYTAKVLGIPFDEFSTWDDFHKVYSEAKDSREEKAEDRSKPILTQSQLKNVRSAEKMLGYQFKDPLLFVEAMTHASHIRNDSVCYQRLEFLGDAVLDFQVVRYYYEKFPTAQPGVITVVKDASVNNTVLGAISLNWGLHKYLNHYSPALVGAIARTIVLLEEKKEVSPTQELEHEYWSDMNMPKVLGDLVESTLGAVFVDSGFDFEVVTDLFSRLIRPFLDKYVNLSNIVLHPTKMLIELLQAKGCSLFSFKLEDRSAQVSTGTKMLRKLGLGLRPLQLMEDEDNASKCHFKIHDRIMATVTGEDSDDLKKQVAIAALAKLNSDPSLLASLCTCPKRRGARQLTVLDRYMQDPNVQ
ncbi:Dicer-like protein 1 [Modicella reniformis]|uniref:Dicer-like protein 1 n=1 Tax=Modicella reniformis TaxID=1440133 RepID=A0A9P6M970_9FUNG|nr:Dicer-like protein 1 [Modicella reniformis]